MCATRTIQRIITPRQVSG